MVEKHDIEITIQILEYQIWFSKNCYTNYKAWLWVGACAMFMLKLWVIYLYLVYIYDL